MSTQTPLRVDLLPEPTSPNSTTMLSSLELNPSTLTMQCPSNLATTHLVLKLIPLKARLGEHPPPEHHHCLDHLLGKLSQFGHHTSRSEMDSSEDSLG